MSLSDLINPNTLELNKLTECDFLSNTQTVNNNTTTYVAGTTLDSTYNNKLGLFVPNASGGSYTADRPGMYTCAFSLNCGGASTVGATTGLYYLFIQKTDAILSQTTVVAENQSNFYNATIAQIISCSAPIRMNTGDSVKFGMFQLSGGNFAPVSMKCSCCFVN